MYWGNIYPSCGQTMARMAALLVLLVVVALGERLDAAEDSDRWEATIAAFEEQDRRAPPTPGAVLFVGSSSIRLWDLTKSFPGTSMINRGFGGSEIEDSIRFAARIVFPYHPRTIVLYAGDNDVARGKSARTVLRDFREFVRIVREALPNTRVVFIAIKPSIRRWALIETIRAANELVRRETELDDRLTYVDVDAPMISDDGRPRAELLASDGLHLSERGYRLWADLVRPHLKPEPESLSAMSETHAEYERVPLERATLRPMVGTVVEYESKLYGDRQPFAVCATDVGDVPKPLIVDLIPGTLGRVDQVPADCERMCEYAKANGFECVALRPCGRGNGTVYQGYGEIDVYEAIEAVKKLVKIDPDRVAVTGVSMGGAATWFHASHYPDVWAAAAPFCGYCNYKLWGKPGGTTFHRQPWEEFSWVSRGAAYRTENFRHLPVRITHGEWDRAVGGGVPVEHSRQMYRRLARLGKDPGGARSELVEVPKTGHSCRLPDLWEKTIVWLLKQRRVASADHVTLVVHTLRHHRSRWVSVEQQLESGRVSHVDARFNRELQRVVVSTKNVRRLALGPIKGAAQIAVRLDDSAIEKLDLSTESRFERSPDGTWTPLPSAKGFEVSSDEKRPDLSGPFGDLFYGPTVLVYGTTGTDEETHFNQLMANEVRSFYNRYNGGVHRGGITGDNEVKIPIVSDRRVLERGTASDSLGPDQVDDALLGRANLLLIGSPTSNGVFFRLGADLPVEVSASKLTLAGKSYTGERVGCFAVFPHPDGARYVAVLTGTSPDAITWGSHVGIQLLPDYIVFERDTVLGWGFWGYDWR